MKGERNATQVNMVAFEVFFAVLLITAGGMFWFVRRLPEKTGAVDPLLQGGWMLRPFRGVANLINLIERPVDKRKDSLPDT